MSNRVFITSYSSITALGSNPDKITTNIRDDKFEYCFPSYSPDTPVIPLKDFKLRKIIGRNKDARYFSKGTKYAVAAAFKAIENSNLKDKELQRCGLFVGSGPNFDFTKDFPEVEDRKLDHRGLQALWILKYLPNTAASAIAKILQIHGENFSVGTACAASLQAIGEAYRKIKDGYLDCALAGGGDSRINRGGILAYKKAQAIRVDKKFSEKSYAPFSKNRNGFVPGEGAGFFLLESEAGVKKRNSPIIAEVKGFGNSIDGHNMTAPHPEGKWAKKAIENALKEAEIKEIDLIAAHGTGTKLNDEIESKIISEKFPNAQVTALKSWIGHLSAASGATELAILLSSLQSGFIPKIRNLKESCNPDLNFVRETIESEAKNILIENFGFGGQNAALVLEYKNEN